MFTLISKKNHLGFNFFTTHYDIGYLCRVLEDEGEPYQRIDWNTLYLTSSKWLARTNGYAFPEREYLTTVSKQFRYPPTEEMFFVIFDLVITEFPDSLPLFLANTEDYISRYLPELYDCTSCDQDKKWHADNVFVHLLKALDNLADKTDKVLSLATLLHDVGKPGTREEHEL